MHPKDLRIEDFSYHLPRERIAYYPLPARDGSKLLVYRDGHISGDIYRNIAGHIPGGSLLVFNQTRVVHARLLFGKPSGGAIEVFCLEPAADKDIQTAMLEKGGVLWKCLVGGASKWKHRMVLHKDCASFTLSATVAGKNADHFIIQLEWNNPELSFAAVLQEAGNLPLPPYLNRMPGAGDEITYQTVFAKAEGSVAAPTAGLHFTEEVFRDLHAGNIRTDFVTLHVGAGTFRPVKAPTMAEHDMHAEWLDVAAGTVQNILEHMDAGIIAVGTTSLRTLESLYWIGVQILSGKEPDLTHIAVRQWEPYETPADADAHHALAALLRWMQERNLQHILTRTQLLIAPGYRFRTVKGLVTNFHQPQSTLLLLVAAFAGDNWKRIYDYALAHEFRFLSYGDGCLLWRQ